MISQGDIKLLYPLYQQNTDKKYAEFMHYVQQMR